MKAAVSLQYSQIMFARLLKLLLCWFSLTPCIGLPETCDSPVYCYGDLLRTVQLGGIFKSSSTFVNLKMIHNQCETLENFERLKAQTESKPTRAQIITFLNENFQQENEMEISQLIDFNPQPSFLNEITNETIKNLASELVQIWPKLARKIKRQVVRNVEHYSILPLPKPFLVLGEDYTEYYYWGSRWMVEGLLVCGMNESARNIIDGFLYLVNHYGLLPKSGRIYSLRRSQLPLLTSMVNLYYEATKDKYWLRNTIDTLLKDLEYWNNQTVRVKKGSATYTFYRYHTPSLGPRPEQYKEDVKTASYFKDGCQKQRVYSNLKSAAESGWMFSSRWNFDADGGISTNLSHIQTSRVVPVDLNSIFCETFSTLSKFYAILGNDTEAKKWRWKHLAMMKGIEEILWNDEHKIWFDYDLKLSKHRKYFYPSNVGPLAANCFDATRSEEMGKHVLNFLKYSKVLDCQGGIPTSSLYSGLEWDFPNAFPPLQHLVVKGLVNTNYTPALDQAETIAKRLINSILIGYSKTGIVFQQYSAVNPGEYGTGDIAEEIGYGWTNAIALKFISTYYTKAKP